LKKNNLLAKSADTLSVVLMPVSSWAKMNTSAAEVQQDAKIASNSVKGPPGGSRSSASSLEVAADAQGTVQIAALSTTEQMQARAVDILKAKNRLPTEDAKQIEAAFSVKMAAFEKVQSQSDSAAIAAIEDERGNETVIAPNAVAPSAAEDEPKTRSVPTRWIEPQGASNAPTIETPEPSKIDKNVLTFCEPRRKRDKQHLRFVASQPCLICGRAPSDGITFASPNPALWDANQATNS
jgi:hypothetical protein